MVVQPDRLSAIQSVPIKGGGHASMNDGACVVELVSWVAGEPWSDHPACVSPVLGAFMRSWNDGMRSDEEREQLKPYIPLLIGTAGNAEADEERSWMALDWLVRVHTVAWLNLAGGECAVHAAKLAALPVIHKANVSEARPVIDAAWAAARAAAGDAAWAAAGAAAGDAAWAAAGAAAGDAAGAAAGDAAWAAAGDAAWAAARAAAGDAAWAAAGDAAWAAAWAAAGDAVEGKLEPTVKELQASAHELLLRMIEVGK